MTFSSFRKSMFSRAINLSVLVIFVSTMTATPRGYAQEGIIGLPQPGTMVNLSSAYVPLMITGLTVHPENPLLMDFIVSTGNSGMNAAQVKQQSDRLIKYFLACLTIPEGNQWVNLSPYEKQRVIPDDLGHTVLGQDMLMQDYLLKQLTASLIYPEKNLGKSFWNKVYTQAREKFGATTIPVNTFNKVWILPDTAKVYAHKDTVFVVKSHLKVMLDEDYLSLSKHTPIPVIASEAKQSPIEVNTIGNQIVRQIILPAVEEEVNQGKNFAQLRQIYNSMILAVWFKKNLKQALLSQVYANKSKISGVNTNDPAIKEKIYRQYIDAYKRGVFNYIKEDSDPQGTTIPRKYFSGGLVAPDSAMIHTETTAEAQRDISEPAGDKEYRISGLTNPDLTMSGEQFVEKALPDSDLEQSTIGRFMLQAKGLSLQRYGAFQTLIREGREKREITYNTQTKFWVMHYEFTAIGPYGPARLTLSWDNDEKVLSVSFRRGLEAFMSSVKGIERDPFIGIEGGSHDNIILSDEAVALMRQEKEADGTSIFQHMDEIFKHYPVSIKAVNEVMTAPNAASGTSAEDIDEEGRIYDHAMKATPIQIDRGVDYWQGNTTTTPITRPFRASRQGDVKDVTLTPAQEKLRSERIALQSLLHGEGVIGMLVAGASSRMGVKLAPQDVLSMANDKLESKAGVPIGIVDGKAITYLDAFGMNVHRLLEQIKQEALRAGVHADQLDRNEVLLMTNEAYIQEQQGIIAAQDDYGLQPQQIRFFNQPLDPIYWATPADVEKMKSKLAPDAYEAALAKAKDIQARLVAGQHDAVVVDNQRDPLGHGEFFHQLIVSGELLHMFDTGKKWFFIKNVDNYAAKFDRVWLQILGNFLQQHLDFQPEVSPRAPAQKGGSLIVMEDTGSQQLAEDPNLNATLGEDGKPKVSPTASFWFNDAVAIGRPQYVASLYSKPGQTLDEFLAEYRAAVQNKDQNALEAIAERGRAKFPKLLDPKPAKNEPGVTVKIETNMWQSTGIVPPSMHIQAIGVRGARNFNITAYPSMTPTQKETELANLRFLATKQWDLTPEARAEAKKQLEAAFGREVTDAELDLTLESYKGNKQIADDLLNYILHADLITTGILSTFQKNNISISSNGSNGSKVRITLPLGKSGTYILTGLKGREKAGSISNVAAADGYVTFESFMKPAEILMDLQLMNGEVPGILTKWSQDHQWDGTVIKNVVDWYSSNAVNDAQRQALLRIIGETSAYVDGQVSPRVLDAFKAMAGDNAMTIDNGYVDGSNEEWTPSLLGQTASASPVKTVTYGQYTASLSADRNGLQTVAVFHGSATTPIFQDRDYGIKTIRFSDDGALFIGVLAGEDHHIEEQKVDLTGRTALANAAMKSPWNRGGIDLNAAHLNLQSEGDGVNITFDPAMIAQFKRGNFSGVKFQILEVVPVDLMPLLGLK